MNSHLVLDLASYKIYDNDPEVLAGEVRRFVNDAAPIIDEKRDFFCTLCCERASGQFYSILRLLPKSSYGLSVQAVSILKGLKKLEVLEAGLEDVIFDAVNAGGHPIAQTSIGEEMLVKALLIELRREGKCAVVTGTAPNNQVISVGAEGVATTPGDFAGDLEPSITSAIEVLDFEKADAECERRRNDYVSFWEKANDAAGYARAVNAFDRKKYSGSKSTACQFRLSNSFVREANEIKSNPQLSIDKTLSAVCDIIHMQQDKTRHELRKTKGGGEQAVFPVDPKNQSSPKFRAYTKDITADFNIYFWKLPPYVIVTNILKHEVNEAHCTRPSADDMLWYRSQEEARKN